MTVESLNCPNCGAGVASDSTQCEFCKTRLKTMACPSCLGLMFIGTQFCGHCGAKMVQATAKDVENLGDCPRCRVPLELLQIDNVALRQCRKCDGMWSDVETFEHLCQTREEQSAVLGFIGDRNVTVEPRSTVSYVPCPDCKQLMNRNNFGRASGIIIDTCKKHGAWFDANELPAIIEFILKGGMEIAREKERTELRDERDRLRDERNRQAAFERRIGSNNAFLAGDQAGILSFVRKLFD